MGGSRSRVGAARSAVALVITFGALVLGAAPGVAKPNRGTGIGTGAARDDPRCNTGEEYGAYGRWSSSVVGAGPPCVVPLSANADNGGATSRGVTADAIKIVYVLPGAAIAALTAELRANAIDRATGRPSTDQDAIHDILVPLMRYYETWGRDLDIEFYAATGSDEAAQRADAVAIAAKRPFIVIDGSGGPVLASTLANGKTVVFSQRVTPRQSAAAAPYLWGGFNPDASMASAAELVGKQLVGKKAEWAGSPELQGATRRFALVTTDGIASRPFTKTLAKYGGKLTSELSRPESLSGVSNLDEVAAELVPTMVTRMKSDGVTTVVLADTLLTRHLMVAATAQSWYPEWFLPATGYPDAPTVLPLYPADQVAHMFGMSLLVPYLVPQPNGEEASLTPLGDPMSWFWGPMQGTAAARLRPLVYWLMNGVHLAGPHLTPETFARGLFAMPGTGDGNPLIPQSGFGEVAGFSEPSYALTTVDFAPVWVAPDVAAPTAVGVRKPSLWFVGGGQRYGTGEWPTKKIAFFDPDASISHFDARPASVAAPVKVPCDGCPSTGGSDLVPGAPNMEHFVIEAPARRPNGGSG